MKNTNSENSQEKECKYPERNGVHEIPKSCKCSNLNKGLNCKKWHHLCISIPTDKSTQRPESEGVEADCPSLSELIEELHKTNQFASLRFVEDEWIASEWDDVDSSPRKEKGRGATPEIAVANLYLAIN